LLADNGIGFVVPGKRPYHFVDFRFTFLAPGVSGFTRRRFTNRAPGVFSEHGFPAVSSQQSLNQILNDGDLKERRHR
jgi:hypothetical protein